MDEQTISAEERLKQLNEERKTLRKQVLGEREIRLEENAKMRVIRDEKIEKTQERLKKVSEVIYHYNKLGKVEKDKTDILGDIIYEINRSEESPESVE